MPLGKEVGLGPGHIVLVTQRPRQQPLPTFWPMSIVAKWSPISATAELVFTKHLRFDLKDMGFEETRGFEM